MSGLASPPVGAGVWYWTILEPIGWGSWQGAAGAKFGVLHVTLAPP